MKTLKLFFNLLSWTIAFLIVSVAIFGFRQTSTCAFSMSTGACEFGCTLTFIDTYSPQCVQVSNGCCIGVCEVYWCVSPQGQCENPRGVNRWTGGINSPNPNKFCPDNDWTDCDQEHIGCEDLPSAIISHLKSIILKEDSK